MKTSAQLKAELDSARAQVNKLYRTSIRSGRGPSAEYKAAFQAARILWREWCNALDIEQGRPAAFSVTEHEHPVANL